LPLLLEPEDDPFVINLIPVTVSALTVLTQASFVRKTQTGSNVRDRDVSAVDLLKLQELFSRGRTPFFGSSSPLYIVVSAVSCTSKNRGQRIIPRTIRRSLSGAKEHDFDEDLEQQRLDTLFGIRSMRILMNQF
jgi:hypothetical protein